MYQVISKEDIFRSIIDNKDVFIIKPAEEKCVWANPMTVSDIMAMINGDYVAIVKEEAKRQVNTANTYDRYVDMVKFTEMLHAQNIRQAELARLAGVSDFTIYNYIYHKGKPRKKTLEKVCAILKCDPADILED